MTRADEDAIRRRIRGARLDAGLTAEAMAGLLDVGLRTYRNYEAGENAKDATVPWALINEIAAKTNVDPGWLLWGDESIRAKLAEMEREQSVIMRALSLLARNDAGILNEVETLLRELETAHRELQEGVQPASQGSGGPDTGGVRPAC